MGRAVYIKLIITAFITSVAIGGFAALNFYIFKGLDPPREKILHIRPTPAPTAGLFILGNSLYMTGAMLLIWLINIGILLVKKRIIRYVISFLIAGLLLGYTSKGPPRVGTAHQHATPTYKARNDAGQVAIMTAVVLNTIVLAILELILVQHHKAEVELENTRLTMSHLLARHQHLQHQLHPHFLFNSLNTLKTLIRTSAGAAEDYLLRLSFFLRASLANNEQALIPLAEEWQLCCYFMDMQTIRYGDAFGYTQQIPAEVLQEVQVPAFSLQLLVENAVKHNAFTMENPLHVHIAYNDGCIVVQNNKQPKTFTEPSSRIGLKNLSERYRMLSGNDIEVIDDEHQFIVIIKALKK